jgi:hypothetical protein
MPRSRLALLGLVGFLAACPQEEAPLPIPDLGKHAAADFVNVSFEELYPVFLWRRSMSQGEKSNQWSRYRDRWVRWEGVIASITTKGVTFKHLRSTVTFDVSLTCEADSLKRARSLFAAGDRVRYVGRLSSFDDIFRTMYLTHGALIEKVPHGDLGVPADLAVH